jgi:hypothetical protein
VTAKTSVTTKIARIDRNERQAVQQPADEALDGVPSSTRRRRRSSGRQFVKKIR